MIVAFLPAKKLRRNGKYVLFGVILLVGALAVYYEMVAAKSWSEDPRMNGATEGNSWRKASSDQMGRRDNQQASMKNSAAWGFDYTPQTWKPEYKGQANLHVFEDWCGSSTADLRRNLHYPLYPHSRTTVEKLAVSPQWTNYGLRIFGYLHPYTDGEFVFAVSSDDNSEFWLSKDDTPLNLEILAWVGKTGVEWTAPGEFDKYASQTSRPVRLSAQRRYFFEVIHKQNNRGTDHVEVAWQLLDSGFRFMVIESTHISLYVNESALLISDVGHIPQTAASHERTPTKQYGTADMLREDPRDSFYHVPLINSKFLQGVLPDCSYQPSYIIKDFPLLRYQGLQFVHLSCIYPNDYTRLTHMETEDSCFYSENPSYMKRFGFSRYMRLNRPDSENTVRDFGFGDRFNLHFKDEIQDEKNEADNEAAPRKEEVKQDRQKKNALFQDYGDDYDDYAKKRRRKLFSLGMQENENMLKNISDAHLNIDRVKGRENVLQPQLEGQIPAEPLQLVPTRTSKDLPAQDQNQAEMKLRSSINKTQKIKPKRKSGPIKRKKIKSVVTTLRPLHINPLIPVEKEQLGANRSAVLSHQLPSEHHVQQSHKMRDNQIQRLKDLKPQPLERNASMPKKPPAAQQQSYVTGAMEQPSASTRHFASSQLGINTSSVTNNQMVTVSRKSLKEMDIQMNMLQRDVHNTIHRGKKIAKGEVVKNWPDERGEENQVGEEEEKHHRIDKRTNIKESDRDSWGQAGNAEGGIDDNQAYDSAPLVFDTEVSWSQTFEISHLDLQAERSDWIDLRCNISGNIVFRSSDAQSMVSAFMEELNDKHPGQFTLVRVVNVVKRVDGIQGNRYLLELELKDVSGQLLRLSHYIYALIRRNRHHIKDFKLRQQKPQLVLCNPVGFRWNPGATVNFIVPVKNQARWVKQLISDMENLHRETGDTNFNLIIADYGSTDMDVEKTLHASTLHRYQYVKLSGNFERSAGLQAGINLITDDHSIVFLCDLHIHFPSSIIDTIRKHCVEGYMAFAPIVMRLDCGATPSDARGYWEVNGFGLLAIYKSDLDAVGGMNTREFTDRWGGEDWELLDRIFQAGLEVERIYLRNFFHHFHSKRGMWNRRTSSSHK